MVKIWSLEVTLGNSLWVFWTTNEKTLFPFIYNVFISSFPFRALFLFVSSLTSSRCGSVSFVLITSVIETKYSCEVWLQTWCFLSVRVLRAGYKQWPRIQEVKITTSRKSGDKFLNLQGLRQNNNNKKKPHRFKRSRAKGPRRQSWLQPLHDPAPPIWLHSVYA